MSFFVIEICPPKSLPNQTFFANLTRSKSEHGICLFVPDTPVKSAQ
jgi:hypothetical protein